MRNKAFDSEQSFKREMRKNHFIGWVILLAFFAMVFFSIWGMADFVQGLKPEKKEWVPYHMQQAEIYRQINEYRRKKNVLLDETYPDYKTCKLAKERLKEVAEDFSHEGFQNRIHSVNFGYARGTENLAKGYAYNEVVKGWIDSPSHERNLLAATPNICVEGDGTRWVMIGLSYY